MKRYNPHGFFELPIRDIQNLYLNDEPGKVVKMNGYLLLHSNTDNIEKLLLCRRWDLNAQAKSMYDLAQVDLHIADTNDIYDSFASRYVGKTIQNWKDELRSHDVILNAWCKEKKIDFLTVYFEDITTKPQQEIDRVVDFLGLKDIETTQAVEIVRTR